MNQHAMEQKLNEVTDKIVREYQPEKIFLFGSWVWGTPDKNSDFDLLIIKDTEQPRNERERDVREIVSGSQVPLDVLIYTHREIEDRIDTDRNLFLEDIVRNGRILFDSNPNRIIRHTHRPAELIAV